MSAVDSKVAYYNVEHLCLNHLSNCSSAFLTLILNWFITLFSLLNNTQKQVKYCNNESILPDLNSCQLLLYISSRTDLQEKQPGRKLRIMECFPFIECSSIPTKCLEWKTFFPEGFSLHKNRSQTKHTDDILENVPNGLDQ